MSEPIRGASKAAMYRETTNRVAEIERIIEYPRNAAERDLSQVLINLKRAELVEVLFWVTEVIAEDIRLFALEHFAALDETPNPPDGYISRTDITKAILGSSDAVDQGILLSMWLRFDEINRCDPGEFRCDPVIDEQISRQDLEKFGLEKSVSTNAWTLAG